MASVKDGWIILRTSGRSTLRLSASLSEDGIEAWTPANTKTVRVPRANAKREVTLPLLPSFVFAPSRHLLDLLQIADRPATRRGPGLRKAAHPDFSVFHYLDQIPIIEDDELSTLRALEAKLALPERRRKAKAYAIGAKVRMEEGSFAGMTGVVEQSDRGVTTVCFGGRFVVKINTFILKPIAVSGQNNFAALAA